MSTLQARFEEACHNPLFTKAFGNQTGFCKAVDIDPSNLSGWKHHGRGSRASRLAVEGLLAWLELMALATEKEKKDSGWFPGDKDKYEQWKAGKIWQDPEFVARMASLLNDPLVVEAARVCVPSNRADGEENQQCPICHESSGEFVRFAVCKHAYHATCAASMLLYQHHNCALCRRDVLEPPSEDFAEAVRALDRVGVRVDSCLGDWPEIRREEKLTGATAARVLEIMMAEANHDHDQLGRGLSLSDGGLVARRVRATGGHCSVAHLAYSTALGLVQAAGRDNKHRAKFRDALREGTFATRPRSNPRRFGDDGDDGDDDQRLAAVPVKQLEDTPPDGAHYYHGCSLVNGVVATTMGVENRVRGPCSTSAHSDFGQRLYLHDDWNAAVDWARARAGQDNHAVVLVFSRAVLNDKRNQRNGMDLSPLSRPTWQEVVDSFRADACPPDSLPEEGCDWLAGAIGIREGRSWVAKEETYQLAVRGDLYSVADRALVEVVVVDVPRD